MFPHPAKTDFHICLDEAIAVCFIRRFDHCMSKYSNKDDQIYKKAAEGRNGCLKKFVKNEKIENAYGFATCLYEWVKLHFKRH